MRERFFFDTYALYEFVTGNPNFKKYFSKYEIVCTQLNLNELFYALLKDYDLETARKYYYHFKQFIVPYADDVVEKAMQLKLKMKSRSLSAVDCIGYEYANTNNLKFLTGDKEFRNMSNVEFVK